MNFTCAINRPGVVIDFSLVSVGHPFKSIYGDVKYLKVSKNTAFCFKTGKNERFSSNFKIQLVGEMVITGKLA